MLHTLIIKREISEIKRKEMLQFKSEALTLLDHRL